MITAAEVHALHVPISPISGTNAVGFNSTATFNFTPGNPGGGAYDFMGIALHEMTEVLGRVSLNGAISGHGSGTVTEYTPLDLFRTGTGDSVFSTNGVQQQFNTSGSGDQGDWATTTDAFAASPTLGTDLPFTYADYLAMEAAGWSGNFAGLAGDWINFG